MTINVTKATKTTILIVLLMVTKFMYSQQYVNLSKAACKKRLTKYADKYEYHSSIKETDSTLAFLVRDSVVQNLDILLHFDETGKCDNEQTVLSCDSCYNKYLNRTIADKYYRWTKIDSSTYFARFPYRLILTTGLGNSPSFLIRRSNLSGHEYRSMIKNALDN